MWTVLATMMLLGAPSSLADASAMPMPSTQLPGLCRALPQDAPIRLAFEAAPADRVVRFFACVTGLTFATEVDLERVRIDLVREQPVPLAEAWELFRQVLLGKGLELVFVPGGVRVERILV